MGFLAYGVIGLFGLIGVGRRSVTVLMSNLAFLVRMTRCMMLMNDSRLLFQFSAAFAVCSCRRCGLVWSYVFKGEFVIILVRDYRLILRSQALFVLETL